MTEQKRSPNLLLAPIFRFAPIREYGRTRSSHFGHRIKCTRQTKSIGYDADWCAIKRQWNLEKQQKNG